MKVEKKGYVGAAKPVDSPAWRQGGNTVEQTYIISEAIELTFTKSELLSEKSILESRLAEIAKLLESIGG